MTPDSVQACWETLQRHREALRSVDFRSLPTARRGAGAQLWKVAGLGVDLSHQLTTEQTWPLLEQLARDTGVERALSALFAGEIVNHSERTPALHWLARASRAPTGLSEEWRALQLLRERVEAIAQRLHGGEWRGHSDEPIRDVVQLGIGGSRLAPELLVQALAPAAAPCRCHFLSSLDDTAWHQLRGELDPARTLFVLVSRSFETEETLCNIDRARAWLRASGCPQQRLRCHFVAITASSEQLSAADYVEELLVMPPSLGGRYSLWSAPSLVLALSAGPESLRSLLAGAEAMDEHVRSAAPMASLPVLLGLLDTWYASCWHMPALVVVPYAHALRGLPAHLQQLMLESNGKSVAADGAPIVRHTMPSVWGDIGTESQHSFHQFLHQGTAAVMVDLLLVGSGGPSVESNRCLWSNALAQLAMLRGGQDLHAAEALLLEGGISAADSHRLAPHLVSAGARPVTPIVLERMDAFCLGALLALYEYRVYVAAAVWQINPFDQWGVERGKWLGNSLRATLAGEAPLGEEALRPLADYFAELTDGERGAP